MVEPSKNYFQTLGLKPNASAEEIKRAFKEIAFQFHPDRNPHNEAAEERFKEAVEAYSYLTGNHEAYRALSSSGAAVRGSGDQVQDILKILFDLDINSIKRHSAPLQADLNLELEEAFSGGKHKLTVAREDLCSHCQGSGVESGAKVFTCTYCFGAGEVTSFGYETERHECPKCNGRGFLSSKGCLHCRARGVTSHEVKIKVMVPPQVSEGQVMTLSEEGHEISLGKRGDLFVTIHLAKHPWFTFDGKNIICETTLEMGTAALGGEIQVKTLGGPTKLTIPPGTQSGQIFRLKGLGLSGDQFIKIWVKTPVVVTEKERMLLENLKAVQEAGFWQRLKRWFW